MEVSRGKQPQMAKQQKPIVTLRDLKEEGGCWIPNSFIDNFASLLGSKGVDLYLRLCRAITLHQYPSVESLSEMCRMSKPKVSALLELMLRYEILNVHDIAAIQQGC